MVCRQFRCRRYRSTADLDQVFRCYSFRHNMTSHTVGRGCIETVAGEEYSWRCFCDNIAVKEHCAAVGMAGAELNVVADHEDRDAFSEQHLHDLCKDLLELSIQALGGLVHQQDLRIQ